MPEHPSGHGEGDRRMLRKVFPDFGLSAVDAPMEVRHFVQFVLAGMAAVADDVRKQA
jgi:hypothetical protein